MPAFLAELLSQLRGIWTRLDGGQRLTIGAVVLAAFVGLGGIVWFAGQPSYEVVLRAETPTQLDEAERALGSAGISFIPDGNNILVDRENVSRAHQALFKSGVRGIDDPERATAANGVMQDRLGRVDHQKTKDNFRAQKAVELLEGVVAAYVTSSRPKRSPFASQNNETQPRASVTLQLRRGVPFHAIAQSAVEQVASSLGLPPEYVVAIDSRTKARFKLDENGHAMGGSDFLMQQRKRGQELTDRAQAWLDRLYEGKALVTVTVDLDPEYVSTEEKIQPASPAIISDEIMQDETKGPSATNNGDPSIASSGAGGAAGGSTGISTKKKTQNKRFEPFSGTRRTGSLTPDIRRLSVALVLDKSIEQGQRDSISKAIKSTVGYLDAARDSGLSDSFEMLVEEFPELPELEALAGPGMVDLAREFGPLAGQIIGVLLVLMFLRKLLKAPKTSVGSLGSGGGSGEKEEEKPVVLTPEESRRNLRREIEKSIADDPAAMSRLLEGWLAEQKG